MSFARRLVIVASDHRFGQLVQTHIHMTFLLMAPVVRFEDLPDLVSSETDGLILFLASDPDDAERIDAVVRTMRLQQFPANIGVMQTEEFAATRSCDWSRSPIETTLVWTSQIKDLNAWIRRTLTEGVPFTDLANEPMAERIRRRLCAWTPALEPLVEQLQIAAAHDVTVLIQGETGTGKSHLARLIHECSDRRSERCLVLACGSIPANQVAIEFFGHVRGSSTVVETQKIGKFAAVGRGTLLLDEIDSLGIEHQANLLRVIETGEYEPVGSHETRHCQARIIAATNGNLAEAVDRGTFRRDLYYRLHVITFHLPPLRDRAQDIGPLVRGMVARYALKFGKKIGSVHPDAHRAMEMYPWPGNIRQLENVVQQAVLACPGEELLESHLPPLVRPTTTTAQDSQTISHASSLAQNRETTERSVIVRALEKAAFSRTRAAQILGVSRVTLYKKMKKYGLLTKSTPLLSGSLDLPGYRSPMI